MWTLAGKSFRSRLICGTALFPSPEIMQQAIIASGADAVTVSLRRQLPEAAGGSFFWDLIKSLNVQVLPNTAGCRNSKEAITVAHMARELFDTNWIKLEVTGDDYTLQPDPFALVEAAKALIEDGFEVFPYTTSDLVVAQRLVDAGCKIVMPWASPIGSGQGINDKRSLDILRLRLPDITLIVDAGIGKPSHAAQVMEMGYDGVILTSAIALAHKPVEMARAFSLAVEAGRAGYESGFMEKRSMASPSTPTIGVPFWNAEENTTRAVQSPPLQSAFGRSAKAMPIAWTIGGSDSGGGAGIQADIKAFNALGVHGCSVITAVTAQNTAKVQSIAAVSPSSIQAQIETLFEDLPPSAVKTGMLYSNEIIKQVARFFVQAKAYRICDPVMVATSGNSLLSNEDTTAAFVQHLLPVVDLLTPNLPEAEALCRGEDKTAAASPRSITQMPLGRCLPVASDRWLDDDYIIELANKLRALGPQSVLIKGGHSQGRLCRDYFAGENSSFWLINERIDTDSTHGTGCTLSAAIAACIALNYPIEDAVVIAKAYVSQSLRMATQVGKGHGPIAHGGWPETFTDFPALTIQHNTDAAVPAISTPFPDCGNKPLGIYPIINNSAWLEKLLPLGITTIQLRIKEGSADDIEAEIIKSIDIAKKFNCRLFINDHWQFAITHGAYGVHLGQEDLDDADIQAIHGAGLRLGISTHTYAEVARTIAYKPSYIAIGTIYETTLKKMPTPPQGIAALKRWRRTLPFPLVAIGGITLERLPDVLSTGADGIAVISDILQDKDPIAKTKKWLECYRQSKTIPQLAR